MGESSPIFGAERNCCHVWRRRRPFPKPCVPAEQMGHATAEAVVRAGLDLVPFSFTGESEGVAVESIGVSGIPVELVLPEARQRAMERVKADYPGVLVIDYTLPSAVNGGTPAFCMRPRSAHGNRPWGLQLGARGGASLPGSPRGSCLLVPLCTVVNGSSFVWWRSARRFLG